MNFTSQFRITGGMQVNVKDETGLDVIQEDPVWERRKTTKFASIFDMEEATSKDGPIDDGLMREKLVFFLKTKIRTKDSSGSKFVDPENLGDDVLKLDFSGSSFSGVHLENKKLIEDIAGLQKGKSELQDQVDLLKAKANDRDTLYHNEELRMETKVDNLETKLEQQEAFNDTNVQ